MKKRIEKITLFLKNGTWMSQSDDPQRVTLFGTSVLPTAYRAAMRAVEVVEHMQELCPRAEIKIRVFL